MLFVAVYMGYPIIGGVLFLKTLDFSYSILGISVFSLLGGGIGILLAVTNYTVWGICFCVWKEDFKTLFIYGLNVPFVYLIWRLLLGGMKESGC